MEINKKSSSFQIETKFSPAAGIKACNRNGHHYKPIRLLMINPVISNACCLFCSNGMAYVTFTPTESSTIVDDDSGAKENIVILLFFV